MNIRPGLSVLLAVNLVFAALTSSAIENNSNSGRPPSAPKMPTSQMPIPAIKIDIVPPEIVDGPYRVTDEELLVASAESDSLDQVAALTALGSSALGRAQQEGAPTAIVDMDSDQQSATVVRDITRDIDPKLYNSVKIKYPEKERSKLQKNYRAFADKLSKEWHGYVHDVKDFKSIVKDKTNITLTVIRLVINFTTPVYFTMVNSQIQNVPFEAAAPSALALATMSAFLQFTSRLLPWNRDIPFVAKFPFYIATEIPFIWVGTFFMELANRTQHYFNIFSTKVLLATSLFAAGAQAGWEFAGAKYLNDNKKRIIEIAAKEFDVVLTKKGPVGTSENVAQFKEAVSKRMRPYYRVMNVMAVLASAIEVSLASASIRKSPSVNIGWGLFGASSVFLLSFAYGENLEKFWRKLEPKVPETIAKPVNKSIDLMKTTSQRCNLALKALLAKIKKTEASEL